MKLRLPENIFQSIPDEIPEEVCEAIVRTDTIVIERIVSHGQASHEGFWYDQEKSEWVMVLQGRAGLLFEGWEEPVVLQTGDWINIPAHAKHRVEWTDPNEKTIWLAVYY
ncbi:cupin domain-containing protein [Syntrophobacter fumaroxidans]|uniref:Phosphoribosylaminoimidazole carboxylase ATPase subunit n=1 Tax=Syntrophobacter fumaroxidans (strain DSM 10017 / MPOB) TaxID=335543 RepID=A0LFS5_SYNFM|nr:cupin domain-containing protein [Syntrophobacter fumaroxidans]ABK16277.1 phosphoribosylaminoimidazole carboxylase ATPase subunit [Syntrophobacter fumaroxidans MPOB]